MVSRCHDGRQRFFHWSILAAFSKWISPIASVVDNRNQNQSFWRQQFINDSFPVPPDTQYQFAGQRLFVMFHFVWTDPFRILLYMLFIFHRPLSIFSKKAQFCLILVIRKWKFNPINFLLSNHVAPNIVLLCVFMSIMQMFQNDFMINV